MIKAKRSCKIWPAIDTCACKKNGIRTYLKKTSKNKKNIQKTMQKKYF